MPFTALYKEDTINSLLLEPAIWDQLKASEKEYRKLKCPECEEPMVARAGEGYKIRPHFAHRHDLIENPEGDRKPCSLKSESSELKCHRLFRPQFRKFNPRFVSRIP